MDNTTTMDLFSTEDVMEITQHVTYTSMPTVTSSLDINNSTQTTWTTAADNSTHTTWTTVADNSTQTTWTTVADTVELSTAALGLYFAMRVLWAGMAIFGNSLTMFAVIRFERLQTCTNYLICSLAGSDLLAGLILPLMMVHELYPSCWIFIPICLLEKILSILSSTGNMLNILYISIDRYIYIAFPLRYHSLVTPCRTVTLLSLIWSFCLLSIPTMVLTGNHLQVGMPCTYRIFLNDWVKNYYLAPQFFVVVFLTIMFHLAIARIAHNQARRIHAQPQPYSTLDVEINQSTRKISHTLATFLGVYLVCILPQALISRFSPGHFPHLERFTILLYWTNTWVNPLIYSWRLKDFRIAFKRIFTGTGSFIEVPGIPV